MEITKTTSLTGERIQQLSELWNEEYQVELNYRLFELLESAHSKNHYLIEDEDRILAWAIDFVKENERRFSIIVSSEHQGKGYGKQLMLMLIRDVGEFYGWVVDHNNAVKKNGEVYKSPLEFYKKLGFVVIPHERIDTEVVSCVKVKYSPKVFIETERLIIREILPSDVDAMFALDSDPEVHRYIGNEPVTYKQQIVDVITMIRQEYQDFGIGRWAVIDKVTHQFLGWSGLKFVTYEINNQCNYYDLGYRFRKKYWGFGLATEAAKACLAYAFNVLNANSVYAIVDVKNEASNKILSKLGFHLVETFEYEGDPHFWYAINRK